MSKEISTAPPLRQPKALFLLVAVQMWECFSFYGMRALLVLYMITQLKFSDWQALSIFAVYTGLVELGGVLGGMIADRILGLRKAISLGGWLIAGGHVLMAFQSTEMYLFMGLALIVVGSSLFSTNTSALLSLYYKQEDGRREEGFTLFYVGINLGALLASLLCGAVGENYGWHYGFSLAAIGMVIGNIMLHCCGDVLEGKGLPPKDASIRNWKKMPVLFVAVALLAVGLAHASLLLHLLPWISVGCIAYVLHRMVKMKKLPTAKLITLCVYLGSLAVFYAAEEQIGSTLMLFSERHVAKSILGFTIPATVLLSLNPMTVLLIGPCINRLLRRFTREISGSQRHVSWRIIAALLMAATAFFGMFAACLMVGGTDQLPVITVMSSIVIISLAELFVGPAVYSFCSEVAPEGEEGTIMGLVPLGFSLASFLGGHLSQLMAVPDHAIKQSMQIYAEGFGITAGFLIVMALLIGAGMPFIHRNAKYKEIKT